MPLCCTLFSLKVEILYKKKIYLKIDEKWSNGTPKIYICSLKKVGGSGLIIVFHIVIGVIDVIYD